MIYYNFRGGRSLKTAVGLAMLILILVGDAGAATFTVCPSGCIYSSIQVAINAASNGDTITVNSGTYYENVNVNKQLTLRGIGMPIVDNNGSGSAITLSADGIKLEGFSAISINFPRIMVLSNNNNLSGNRGGIFLSSSSNNTLIGNAYGDRSYVYLDSSKNNTLINNNANSNVGDGINLYSSSNNTLIANNANSNYGYGIYLSASSNNNILIGNTANANYGDYRFSYEGISLIGSSNNTLINNNANSNSGGGIYLGSSSNNTLSGNNANWNQYFGISLIGSSNNTLSGNGASSNLNFLGNYNYGYGSGIYLSSSNNNTLSGNNASNNKEYGIYLSASNFNNIHNNIFNNTKNFEISYSNYNAWNTTNTSVENIVGGPCLGGNFWAYPNGTGFSQTCLDVNKDGICDLTYLLGSNNIDYLPLAKFISIGITVFYPNGGENISRGTTQMIRWNYTGSPGSFVNITLLKSGVFNRTINSSIPIGNSGSGYYNWLINSIQTPGTDYKVKITSTTNATYNDTSDNNFTILSILTGTISGTVRSS